MYYGTISFNNLQVPCEPAKRPDLFLIKRRAYLKLKVLDKSLILFTNLWNVGNPG